MSSRDTIFGCSHMAQNTTATAVLSIGILLTVTSLSLPAVLYYYFDSKNDEELQKWDGVLATDVQLVGVCLILLSLESSKSTGIKRGLVVVIALCIGFWGAGHVWLAVSSCGQTAAELVAWPPQWCLVKNEV